VVASLLDYLPDTRWLYILGLELLALFFFAILYAPFAIYSLLNSRRDRAIA
jgi:hypothetical protein